MIDLSLLTGFHWTAFGANFLFVWGALAWMMRSHRGLLRRAHAHKRVFYAGVLPMAGIALSSFIILDDFRLIVGVLGASFLVLLIGARDEQDSLSPQTQLVWQIVIALLVVSWGWGIGEVSRLMNDGVISLEQYSFAFLTWPGALISVLWLLLLMNAVNWLDGVDGLATGVGTVAFVVLAAVSMLPQIAAPTMLGMALACAGALLGILLWNFSPAHVQLGTTGSWFLGLMLGLVAVISGGKLVTTVLVLALPVVDLLFVVWQRWRKGQPIWQGDTVHHLHHKLKAIGWSDRKISIVAMVVTAVLGTAAVSLQSHAKAVALMIAGVVIVGTSVVVAWRQHQGESDETSSVTVP